MKTNSLFVSLMGIFGVAFFCVPSTLSAANAPKDKTPWKITGHQNCFWKNSNYMFGTFSVDNVQYEKYAAGLAQKEQQEKRRPRKNRSAS